MAAFENIRVIGHAKLDLNSMPPQDRRNFIADTFEAMERYYSDPKNVAAYEKWEAERQKGKTANASA